VKGFYEILREGLGRKPKRKLGLAKKAYRDFVQRGIDQGRRSDLVGGGLIRSQGGWSAVKTMRRLGVREKSDERILGSGDFIEQLIEHSDRTSREQFSDQERIQRVALLVEKVCKKEKVSVEALRAGSRRQNVSKLRAQLAKKLVEECGFLLVEAGRHLGVSPSAVAKILSRQDEYKYR
jgi:putative transposase